VMEWWQGPPYTGSRARGLNSPTASFALAD